MIARAGSGWQTVLADLSLILFMATASAVGDAPAAPAAAPPAVSPAAVPALGEPVAQWRQGPGAPALAEWLAANADPRLRLTILAPPSEADAALGLAAAATQPARLVLEPGAAGVTATLTYDQVLAQGLQSGE